jgi:hypothetical protein
MGKQRVCGRWIGLGGLFVFIQVGVVGARARPGPGDDLGLGWTGWQVEPRCSGAGPHCYRQGTRGVRVRVCADI